MFRLAALVGALLVVGCASGPQDDQVVLLDAAPPARSSWLTKFRCEKDRVEILHNISVKQGEPKFSLVIKLNGRKLDGANDVLLELQRLSDDEQTPYLFSAIGCPVGDWRMTIQISSGNANWYLWVHTDEHRLEFVGDGSRFETE